jgi:CII-binding regulator of phage lambda lysogenization HflD
MTEPHKISPDEVEATVEDLRKQLTAAAQGTLQRVDCNQENIEQSLARLVLSLIELVRRLLERQAIRRMEGATLTSTQEEEMGLALMKLEAKIAELAAHFGLKPEDLNLELGPLGNLLPKD